MSDSVFTDDDLQQGTGEYKALGPSYFSGRRFAEQFMEKFEADCFKPFLDDFAKKFADRLWSDVEDHLVSDVESNIQGHIWRTVDEMVKALLHGERWALERYVLSEKYDCEKVRANVARYVVTELQDKRIADLEADNKRLRESLEWSRR